MQTMPLEPLGIKRSFLCCIFLCQGQRATQFATIYYAYIIPYSVCINLLHSTLDAFSPLDCNLDTEEASRDKCWRVQWNFPHASYGNQGGMGQVPKAESGSYHRANSSNRGSSSLFFSFWNLFLNPLIYISLADFQHMSPTPPVLVVDTCPPSTESPRHCRLDPSRHRAPQPRHRPGARLKHPSGQAPHLKDAGNFF